MNSLGMILMLASTSLIAILTFWCFFKVLTTPNAAATEHAPLDIDTRDADPPR